MSQNPLQAPANGVTVRMYAQGFGDCFLLAFPSKQGGGPYYVLIDCGVHQSVTGGPEAMQQVVDDIKAATGGKIHLLIVTHRHADHISGFRQAQASFSKMTIYQVWLPWLEDPEDEAAHNLWLKADQTLEDLRRAAAARPGSPAMGRIADVLGFTDTELGWKAGDDRLKYVRDLVHGEKDRLQYPQPGGKPHTLPQGPGVPEVPDVCLYVMGPPIDPKLIAHMGEKGDPEIYPLGPRLAAQMRYTLGELAMDPPPAGDAQTAADQGAIEDDKIAREATYPFSENLRIPLRSAETTQSRFFRAYYGFVGESGVQGPDWRRIDDDWLGIAEAAIEQIDDIINNTSLVLAIELPKTKKVLLFVGDAQVGNWLSWHDVPWSVQQPDGTNKSVTVQELLARTALYKVGHHGSENATVRQREKQPWGLELISPDGLVAMLPTEEQWARTVPGWYGMPWRGVMDALQKHTSGRIVRMDTGVPLQKPDGMSQEQWDAFRNGVVAAEESIQPLPYQPKTKKGAQPLPPIVPPKRPLWRQFTITDESPASG